MPQVFLREESYRKHILSQYIFGEMKNQKITHEYIANQLGITRQCFSGKVKKGTLTFEELLIVFKILRTDEESILRFFMR